MDSLETAVKTVWIGIDVYRHAYLQVDKFSQTSQIFEMSFHKQCILFYLKTQNQAISQYWWHWRNLSVIKPGKNKRNICLILFF